MASRQEKLFAELGLLSEEQETNPLQTLGIDVTLARELLKEGGKDALLVATVGMHRVLSRRWHTDVPKTGSREKFEAINKANVRINEASPETLARWAKPDAPNQALQTKRQEQREFVAERAAEIVSNNLKLGRDPRHFSQMEWSQGVLLQRGNATILIEHQETDGITARRGETITQEGSRIQASSKLSYQTVDFQYFLSDHRAFGIEPNTKIAAYMDGTGRATLLKSDLSFMMDITNPVMHQRARRHQKRDGYDADFWSRSSSPILLTTTTPSPEGITGEGQVLSFPAHSRRRGTQAQQLPMEVAGSFTAHDVYRRLRHDRAVGATALMGGTRQANYFGMLALPTREIIEQDIGYTPLITPGNSLLLYDPQNEMPVVTDCRILGMIGNGPQSTN